MTMNYQEYLNSPEWDKLRKFVYTRSNNKCEMCGAPAANVHHVKYPKQFEEDSPANVLALCERCHRLSHGIREIPYVYCAGKIAKNDWRHNLFPGLRGIGTEVYFQSMREDGVIDKDCAKHELDYTKTVRYAGPFFISCDHGCYHGPHTHGLNPKYEEVCAPAPYNRYEIVAQCQNWLKESDMVFAWLTEKTAFGSMVELGWASILGKPIFIASDSEKMLKEAWFAVHLSHVTGTMVGSLKECWEYLMSFQTDMIGN
jgi:hypothetical protein